MIIKIGICAALLLGLGGVAQAAPSGSICGTAWLDGNGDGVRQTGEGPLAGRLMGIQNSANGVTTGADGRYCFTNVEPGTYRLSAVRTDFDFALTKAGKDSKFDRELQTSEPVTVREGQRVRGIDAGFIPADAKAAICGTAWVDHNGDGRRQRNDGPLAGRVFAVQNQAGGVTTGADGRYCVENLEPGTYWVSTPRLGDEEITLTRAGADSKFDPGLRTTEALVVERGERVAGVDAGHVVR